MADLGNKNNKIIAAAQITSIVGDKNENLNKHLEMINFAAEQKADLIIFPEMSLTGYCRAEAKNLVVKPTDTEIITLQEKAQTHALVIVVGAPIEIDEVLYIGSYILMPDGIVEIYTKQFLHEGEELFYGSSFNHNPQIKIKDEIISFAICADIDHALHPRNAKENQCSLYLSSIFFTKNGINGGHQLLSKYASTYAMNILMANYSGTVWGMEAGGASSFWNKKGKAIASLDCENQGLLLVEKIEEAWVGKDMQ